MSFFSKLGNVAKSVGNWAVDHPAIVAMGVGVVAGPWAGVAVGGALGAVHAHKEGDSGWKAALDVGDGALSGIGVGRGLFAAGGALEKVAAEKGIQKVLFPRGIKATEKLCDEAASKLANRERLVRAFTGRGPGKSISELEKKYADKLTFARTGFLKGKIPRAFGAPDVTPGQFYRRLAMDSFFAGTGEGAGTGGKQPGGRFGPVPVIDIPTPVMQNA